LNESKIINISQTIENELKYLEIKKYFDSIVGASWAFTKGNNSLIEKTYKFENTWGNIFLISVLLIRI